MKKEFHRQGTSRSLCSLEATFDDRQAEHADENQREEFVAPLRQIDEWARSPFSGAARLSHGMVAAQTDGVISLSVLRFFRNLMDESDVAFVKFGAEVFSITRLENFEWRHSDGQ